MKFSLVLLSIFSFFQVSLNAQDFEFLWAQPYEVSNCNHLGALTVDTSNNIFIAGVHEGPTNVPYKGDIFIIKTDPEGNLIWSYGMDGELIIGDMAAQNSDIIISGQAYGAFTYKDVTYGGASFYLFVLKLDENGDVIWYYTDDEKNSSYASNLSVDGDKILLHTRTQSNLGDWIMIFYEDGNILNSRLLSPSQTLIVDATFYAGNVYLNGDVNGLSSITIDTIFIPQSPLESTTFVLGMDSALTAKWVSIDTTLNNGDGTLEANENGVFVYEETLQPPFNIVHNLKKFNHSGDLLKEIIVPSFNPSAILFPSMALVGDRLALFFRNSSISDNFKLLILDQNLEIISEKTVVGQSDQYSNQIAPQNKDFVISNVYESIINFNEEITLPYTGSGKVPYIAKLGEPVISEISNTFKDLNDILFYPNPAEDYIQLQIDEADLNPVNVEIYDLSGRTVFKTTIVESNRQLDINQLSSGMHVIKCNFSNGLILQEKLLVR